MKKKIAMLLAGAMMIAAMPVFAAPAGESGAGYGPYCYQQLDDNDDWGCRGGYYGHGRGHRGGYCWDDGQTRN